MVSSQGRILYYTIQKTSKDPFDTTPLLLGPSSHDHRVNYLLCVPITSSTGLSLDVCGVQGYSILPLRVNGLPFSSSATSVMGCADMVPLVMDIMYLFFTVHPLAGLWSLLLITALRPAKFLNLTAT